MTTTTKAGILSQYQMKNQSNNVCAEKQQKKGGGGAAKTVGSFSLSECALRIGFFFAERKTQRYVFVCVCFLTVKHTPKKVAFQLPLKKSRVLYVFQ